jgi:hypothetical protein
MQKTRTPEQILADLDKQFPKTNFVEEGKQTMARKTKATAPEKVQEDPSRVRRILQKHQNKKLTPKQFGDMLTEAFGQAVQYELCKSITAITDNHIVSVQPHHITFDFRGGWGKAVNIRAFIPQNHDGRGVMIRISMDVVKGVWDAKTAKQYEDPHPFEGSAIEQPIAGSGKPREDLRPSDVLPADTVKLQQSSISGMRLPHGNALICGINDDETERSGIVYHTVEVKTGWLATGDTGIIVNPEGVTVCPAEIKNIVDRKGVVQKLGTGNTAAVQFEFVIDEMPVHKDCMFVVQERAVAEGEKKPFSLADLGRRAIRPLHSRNPTPPSRDGYATILGAHPHPSGTQYGVQVKEGTLRIADVLQVWRNGRFHTGANLVAISRANDEAIQILLMGEQAGVFLNIPGITDLKAGDEIYVVDRSLVAAGSVFDNMTIDKDLRSTYATIPLQGMSQKHIVDTSRSALLALGVPVTEIANANSAVMQLLETVRGNNMETRTASLVIEWLHEDEFYPRAVRAIAQFDDKRDACGLGVLFIADGYARVNHIFGVGTLTGGVPELGKPLHGLAALFLLTSSLSTGLDERDHADFENSWLETCKLGLADQVVFRQSRNQVLEVWVEKHKTMPTGWLAATIEFGSRGIERFHFNSPPQMREETLTGNFRVVKTDDGVIYMGPFEEKGWLEFLTPMLGNIAVNVRSAMTEIKRVATEALIDNPDHWKDDEIVPWAFEVRLETPNFISVDMLCHKDDQPSGFRLELSTKEPGVLGVSPVYGFGRFTNLLLLKGIHLTAFFASTILTQHLVADDVHVVRKLLDEVGSKLHHADIVALYEVPERNAMTLTVVRHGNGAVAGSGPTAIAEFALINGRIVTWKFPKTPGAKVQPQPHRHHLMDSEHVASSIVPRPQMSANIQNLGAFQAQTILRTLVVEEGDDAKLALLDNFIEQVCADADTGGTGNALLFGVSLFEGRLAVDVKFIDVDSSHKPVADMSVYL